VTFGVLRFPGSCDEVDALIACERVADARIIWHGDTDLGDVDAIVVPGGFSYGDYLRVGSIARFAPAMEKVMEFAAAGGPVLGICNGFQVLCEAGMLPGALLRNDHLEFRCDWQWLRVERPIGPWLAADELAPGDVVRMPISHGEGRYYADDETLDALEREGRVVLRYAEASGAVTPDANPNGSLRGIAGIVNPAGNVLGLMPHPERASEPDVGGTDGLRLLRSLERWLAAQPATAERLS
jgi:phosphoribosylformylglycinamidine synthase I